MPLPFILEHNLLTSSFRFLLLYASRFFVVVLCFLCGLNTSCAVIICGKKQTKTKTKKLLVENISFVFCEYNLMSA